MATVNALNNAEFEYMQYVAKFNKQTNDVEEFHARMANFQAADAYIKEVNQSNGNWTAGHNQFSDWHYAEYKAILGYRRSELMTKNIKVFPETNADTVNWTEKGAVTPVKDQGQCGSCWSFSTTGSLEGAHQIATGELLSFSEQQLVDCAGIKYGNMGCNGGLQTYAYNYYEAGHKAELEKTYPYTSGTTRKSGSCQYDEGSATAVTVTDYTDVTPNNKSQMKAALNQQPLAVAIEADKMCFQTYKSGVMDNSRCGTKLDHAVLAVGYGTDSASGLDYWLVKNSWNTTWGDNGYIKLAMNDSAGICGVQMDPQSVTTN
jgi:cathepsin L